MEPDQAADNLRAAIADYVTAMGNQPGFVDVYLTVTSWVTEDGSYAYVLLPSDPAMPMHTLAGLQAVGDDLIQDLMAYPVGIEDEED